MKQPLMAIGGPWHGKMVRVLCEPMMCLDTTALEAMNCNMSSTSDAFAPMPLVEYQVRLIDRYHAYLVLDGLTDQQVLDFVCRLDPMGEAGKIQ